jgi:hypothetical protein
MRLSELRSAMGEDATRFDAERVSAHDAARVVEGRSGDGKPSRRAKMLFRIDLLGFLRDQPIGDDVCELVGYGPVAPSAIRDLMDTEDPFLAAVVTKGKEVVGVAHLGRRPNAHQQTALEWLYPT